MHASSTHKGVAFSEPAASPHQGSGLGFFEQISLEGVGVNQAKAQTVLKNIKDYATRSLAEWKIAALESIQEAAKQALTTNPHAVEFRLEHELKQTRYDIVDELHRLFDAHEVPDCPASIAAYREAEIFQAKLAKEALDNLVAETKHLLGDSVGAYATENELVVWNRSAQRCDQLTALLKSKVPFLFDRLQDLVPDFATLKTPSAHALAVEVLNFLDGQDFERVWIGGNRYIENDPLYEALCNSHGRANWPRLDSQIEYRVYMPRGYADLVFTAEYTEADRA